MQYAKLEFLYAYECWLTISNHLPTSAYSNLTAICMFGSILIEKKGTEKSRICIFNVFAPA